MVVSEATHFSIIRDWGVLELRKGRYDIVELFIVCSTKYCKSKANDNKAVELFGTIFIQGFSRRSSSLLKAVEVRAESDH